jgi:hypothetical protein
VILKYFCTCDKILVGEELFEAFGYFAKKQGMFFVHNNG